MGLEKLELLAQKLIQLEDDYDAYEFADTYDDYLPNLDDDKYDGIVGDTMSAIVNNSYDILNELEDMYYDVEGVDEEMANDILSLMDEVEVYSSYTPAERVNENRLLEAYLSKKEIIMENKFESVIRGKELIESNDYQGLDISPFRPFKNSDYRSFRVMSKFKNGDAPLLYQDEDCTIIIMPNIDEDYEAFMEIDCFNEEDDKDITAGRDFEIFKNALKFGKEAINSKDIFKFIKDNESKFDEII